MDTNSYIVFLLLGVLLVVIDGQIIYRSGRQYLEHSYSDPAAAVSVTRLITVLFHLAVLGAQRAPAPGTHRAADGPAGRGLPAAVPCPLTSA
jgi:hypothetical protein